jgi:nicotinic acid phosphoribosyltransferase
LRQKPTAFAVRHKAGLLWNLVLAELRVRTVQFLARALLISADAAERLVPFVTVNTVFPLSAQWHTVGFKMFDSELDAFRAYAREYPQNCTLLVDTYNVLKSGVPHAIQVFREEIVPRGFRPAGIRIDSGDITYLSKKG